MLIQRSQSVQAISPYSLFSFLSIRSLFELSQTLHAITDQVGEDKLESGLASFGHEVQRLSLAQQPLQFFF